MSKKILILGAGNAQKDLIDYCNSCGLETYGCSYSNTDSAIPLLTHFEQINILDEPEIKEYFVRNNTDSIYSVGSDIAVPVFSQVAEECGAFSFVSKKCADICCNKHLLREALSDSIFNLPYYVCDNITQAQNYNSYPYMLKPVDSQGQRGVYLIRNSEELEKHFDDSLSYSKCGKVILEKYIDGNEVSVNAYVINDDIVFSIISDRESFKNLPGGIIKAHHLPSVYEGTKTANRINELVKDTISRLKIHNGPVYFQIKVSDGHPYLIEVTPRLDGCHMHKLIKMYCGVDLLDMTVTQLLGYDIKLKKALYSNSPIHLEFFCQEPNTQFDEKKYINYVADFKHLYYHTGDNVRKLNGYMEKCGYRIYKSPHKIGLIGGSGFVGSSFKDMYKDKFELVDISRKANVIKDYSEKALENALYGCDSVVILAAKKVNQSEKQSKELYDDNVTVVKNTLSVCSKLGIKNIVFTSTRCVYANNQSTPISEDGIIKPINYYGISKRTAEELCEYYNNNSDMNIKILRLAQIIGKDKNGYMVDKFIESALKGNSLTVYGKSVGKRDYIYIKDVCRAIYLSLQKFDKSGIYNIGSGVGTSSEELAKAVINATGSESEIAVIPDKPEDTSVTYLNVSKAKSELRFSCEYTLQEAINDLIK